MRLGFYYHIPAVQEEEKVLTPGYLGLFLDALAKNCDQLTLFQHIPNPGENVHCDYTIQSSNVNLISLPARGSVPHRLLCSSKFTRIIKSHRSSIDGFLLRGPTPLLPALARASAETPKILIIVGDYLAGIDSLPQPWWRKQLIRIWSWMNQNGQLRIAKHSLVFVNSLVLFRKFEGKARQLVETRTTTLSTQDFFKRADTCLTHPIRLLYTGRMDPAKGLLDMVEAVAILETQGYEVVLDLVGWSTSGSDILTKIVDLARQKGISDRIIYHGFKSVGPDLFTYYQNADIYLIASQSSFEGFPRTIWEAMAHSLPVVATRVGSIPDFIEGAAELVAPKKPERLAAGVKRLLDHPELRKTYIKNGFTIASQNTLEVQVGKMSKVIHAWVEGQHAKAN